jgi:hypothetical protein
MGVLRMIKLFGWEGRIRETVAEKREEELRWIWKQKLLGLASSIAKRVIILQRRKLLLIRLLSITIPLVHMVVTYSVYVRLFCFGITLPGLSHVRI